MNKRACSLEVPYGILNTANKCWMKSNPDTCYRASGMEADPKTWALQQFGLGFAKAIVHHIITSDGRVQNPKSLSCYPSRRRKKRVAGRRSHILSYCSTAPHSQTRPQHFF